MLYNFLCAEHNVEDDGYEHDDDVIDEERSYKDEAKPGLTGSHFAIDAVPDHDDDRNHRDDPSHHSHRGLVQIIISTTTTTNMIMIKKRATRKEEVKLRST